MNDEIVKNIKLEDDVILAVDENENELLRFEIKIGEYNYKFRAPSYREHRQLLINYANILTEIANIMPNLLLPDLEMLKNENKWFNWKELSKRAFTSNRVIKLIENIIIMLIDIPKGKTLIHTMINRFKYIRRLKKDLTIFQFQRLFAFIVCIESIVKKNIEFHLEKIYNITTMTTQRHISSNGSMNDMDGRRPDSITPLYSELN